MSAPWHCDLHRVWTSTDCPMCDAEQIADLERYAQVGSHDSPHACCKCRRALRVGETAWASDWTVIGVDGTRMETRYTCETCEVVS